MSSVHILHVILLAVRNELDTHSKSQTHSKSPLTFSLVQEGAALFPRLRCMLESIGHQQDRSELEFLRREVSDLEDAIKHLHTVQAGRQHRLTQAEGALAQTEAALARERDESARAHAAYEEQLVSIRSDLRSVRADHGSALGAAAAREAETRMLGVELRLLCVELFDAEAEREAARASETSALSIARSYRGFAAQGAGVLEDMRQGIETVQGTLLQRLAGYQAAAHFALRLRAMRSAQGWRASRDLFHCFARWMLLALTAEQRAATAQRLQAAYKQRDADTAASRLQAANERRCEREASQVELRRLTEELTRATAECDTLRMEARDESARREAAEARAAALEAELDEARTRLDASRKASAADLAAAREQLAVTRREATASSAAAAAAREGRSKCEAELEACRTAVCTREEEAAAAARMAEAERTAREEESATRAFLERVLRDERHHAALRTAEGDTLLELREDHAALAADLHLLDDDLTEVAYELNAELLTRALASS